MSTHEPITEDGLTIGEVWVAPRGLYAGRWMATDVTGQHHVFGPGDTRVTAAQWVRDRYDQTLTPSDVTAALRAIANLEAHDEDPEVIQDERLILFTRILTTIAHHPGDAQALARAALTTPEEP